jgi:hypothetical protein
MRTRRWLGLLLPVAVACGGEGSQAGDTAVPAPADTQVAPAQSDAAADSMAMPSDSPDTPSSTSRSPGQSASVPSAPIAGADTAVGPVHIMGTALDNRVVVQTSAGPIGVTGEHTETIRRLQGMEVWIQGPLSIAVGRVIPPRQIEVQRFEVRKVGDVPVVDGTLGQADGAWVVTSASGRRTQLSSVPSELTKLAGRRVWLTVGPDGTVHSFGTID